MAAVAASWQKGQLAGKKIASGWSMREASNKPASKRERERSILPQDARRSALVESDKKIEVEEMSREKAEKGKEDIHLTF